MNGPADNSEAVRRFDLIARRFCVLVDSATNLPRKELLIQLYEILPQMISEAITLPDVEGDEGEDANTTTETALHQRVTDFLTKSRTHEQWAQLYSRLKEILGDWDLYWQVFDPTKDNEAIHGSLADDIADIYWDLKEGLNEIDLVRPKASIWHWRFTYYSHWGKHAIDALRTIHCVLQDTHLGTE